ncbi:hypothetical protein GI374_06575 [Paracoccus sp. S-4012]|uniref:hypothetical protein n=1 Tax=Paracoccus sp. S-4012 TaxID=2665648 RepID=UPI0012B00F95|nr:hypothetical protein [Paracoccus sp. S-4012]MRX50121.1 hypothetical protein [Paracoccus sp. S-4012]
MSTAPAPAAWRIAVVLAFSVLVPTAVQAQTASPAANADAASPGTPIAAPEAAAPGAETGAATGALRNPHRLLPELSGGPQGSPTSQRGNPQPGTSTSIPTTNPATVRPVEQERLGPDGQAVSIEDTGIEGQCDPVVSLGCPTIADQLQAGADAGATSDPVAADAEAPGVDAAVEPAETDE